MIMISSIIPIVIDNDTEHRSKIIIIPYTCNRSSHRPSPSFLLGLSLDYGSLVEGPHQYRLVRRSETATQRRLARSRPPVYDDDSHSATVTVFVDRIMTLFKNRKIDIAYLNLLIPLRFFSSLE